MMKSRTLNFLLGNCPSMGPARLGLKKEGPRGSAVFTTELVQRVY